MRALVLLSKGLSRSQMNSSSSQEKIHSCGQPFWIARLKQFFPLLSIHKCGAGRRLEKLHLCPLLRLPPHTGMTNTDTGEERKNGIVEACPRHGKYSLHGRQHIAGRKSCLIIEKGIISAWIRQIFLHLLLLSLSPAQMWNMADLFLVTIDMEKGK